MIDPKRWLDEGGGATFEERQLLKAGRDLRLPDTLRKRVWAGVATGLSAMETAAAAGTALQQGAAAKGTFTLLSGAAAKGVTALAIAGSVGLGIASLRSPAETAGHVVRDAPSMVNPSRALHAPIEGALESPVAREPDRAPAPEIEMPSTEGVKPRTFHTVRPSPRPSAAQSPSRGSDNVTQPAAPSQEARRASRLAEESAAVVAIRKKLMSGEPAEALRMLDRARVEFPDGVLAQEREALALRALVESGHKDVARKRGEAFLRAFPRSPHATELRALLGL